MTKTERIDRIAALEQSLRAERIALIADELEAGGVPRLDTLAMWYELRTWYRYPAAQGLSLNSVTSARGEGENLLALLAEGNGKDVLNELLMEDYDPEKREGGLLLYTVPALPV